MIQIVIRIDNEMYIKRLESAECKEITISCVLNCFMSWVAVREKQRVKKIINKHSAKLTGNKFMIFTIYGSVFRFLTDRLLNDNVHRRKTGKT